MPSILHKTRAAGTKINTSAVWAEAHEIEGGAIGTTEIADDSVTTAKLADGSVTTAKLVDGNVTDAKLADDAKCFRFVKSGTSPIVFAHNMGTTPTGVVCTPNAVQPYAWGYDADSNNITIYHNSFGSLTFAVIAWI